MESEQNNNYRLTELITRAERALDEEIVSEAMAFHESSHSMDEAVQWPRLIGSEAARLYDRMHFLVKHPNLPQFLGGSAIKIVADRHGFFRTGPLFSTETEHKSNLSLSSHIEIGTFITPPYLRTSAFGENEQMTITRVVQEANSGEKNMEEICNFFVHASNGKASRNQNVSLSGGEFDEFRRNKVSEQLDELEKAHPELAKDFKVFKDRPYVGALPSAKDYYALEKIYSLLETYKPEEKEDFPSEMYHLPLGILIQANRVLRGK